MPYKLRGGSTCIFTAAFFLGEDDHIKAAEIIEADVIGEAIHKALVMLRERPEHQTVELWEGERNSTGPMNLCDRIGLTVAKLSPKCADEQRHTDSA